MRWLKLHLGVVLASGALAALGAALLVERVVAFKVRQIMQPQRAATYTMTDEAGHPIPQVTFPTADGLSLTGWHIPSRNGATLILQHGYRANSAQLLPIGRMLARHGYGVLFFDFRGHGHSAGEWVTLGLHEAQDTHAAVAFLRQHTAGPIGVLGLSMGGAAGVLAAAENPHIQALVIEGVFAELKDEVGIGITLQTPLPAWPFAPLFIFFAERQTRYRLHTLAPVNRIGAIGPRPVLILHGGQDTRIARDSGARLFAAAQAPKEFWPESTAAHVAFYETLPADYERRVVGFFNRHLGLARLR